MTLTIIGAGPGGYETAVAAASAGIEVNLISGGPLGGTCLNEGCIPTKTLCRDAEILEDVRNAAKFGVIAEVKGFDMKRAQERKNEVVSSLRDGIGFLLKNKLIHLTYGKAVLKDSHTVSVKLTEPLDGAGSIDIVSDYIIVATGSEPAVLPVPGVDSGNVLTSGQMLSLEEIPRRLCVIGAGVIGLEFASIFGSFGSEVTVLEYCKDILPRFDTDLAKRLKQALGKRGISIETSAQVLSVEDAPDGSCTVKYLKKDVECAAVADKVLMAVGRRPAVGNLNLADVGIEFTPKGIVTDADMRTNVPNIFAIGDVRGGMMLAHVAVAEGKRALNTILAESVSGGAAVPCPLDDGLNLDIVPAAVFTSPEAASVGMSEEDCKAAGIPVKCHKAMFRANGKAVSMDAPDGFCKLIVAGEGGAYESGRILGCHIMGAHSSDLIHEAAALISCGAGLDDMRNMIHAHPTLSEVLMSAASS